MNPLQRPDALARHLEENAAAWRPILGKVDPAALGVLGRLEALARTWAELHRSVLAPFGLNYAELTTIGMLRTSPPDFRRSPTELRRLVGQTSAGMARILRKLEATGLVRRARHEEDGRRRGVVLTARGARLAERSFRALHGAQRSLLAGCDRRRRDEILRGLDDLLAAFVERPRGGPVRPVARPARPGGGSAPGPAALTFQARRARSSAASRSRSSGARASPNT